MSIAIFPLLMGRYELNKLTLLLVCGFIAQESIAPVFPDIMGFNPVKALIFSGFFLPTAYKLENLLR